MTVFYNQPTAHRFGTAILAEIDQGPWTALEIAVAWVRRSGMAYVLPSLRRFLERGCVLRVSVGIDIQNTSREGLEDLLSLVAAGTTELYVYHDEAGTVFHPKVYLFRNDRNAKLIVGSNNLTGAGLFINTEAGLELAAPLTNPMIQQAIGGLAAWRETTDRFALPLDAELLRDLLQQGYILPEAQLRSLRWRTRQRTRARARARNGVRRGQALFGRSIVSLPPVPPGGTPGPPPPVVCGKGVGGIGTVLLMRVRKAGESDRPTQTQVPIRLFRQPFFAGMTSVTSAHDGRTHAIIRAVARGGTNTLKLEIPEMRDFLEPVLRLERTVHGITYQAFDAGSVLGRPIFAALQRGLSMTPPATFVTRASSPERSTWWRFI
jgi:PLD-like domain